MRKVYIPYWVYVALCFLSGYGAISLIDGIIRGFFS